ncbi:MAG: endonuclease domain-containing protein [Bacteroidetes bacterium]|nr:endonuclease domain-containing protein [Bacteroidota bacterium]
MDNPFLNDPRVRERRRALRANSTPAEQNMWRIVRDRRLCGFKFRRQRSIGPYILDFYCSEAKLAVELDGSVHDNPARAEYDRERQEYVEALGLRVLRFRSSEVIREPNRVAETLLVMLRRD